MGDIASYRRDMNPSHPLRGKRFANRNTTPKVPAWRQEHLDDPDYAIFERLGGGLYISFRDEHLITLDEDFARQLRGLAGGRRVNLGVPDWAQGRQQALAAIAEKLNSLGVVRPRP